MKIKPPLPTFYFRQAKLMVEAGVLLDEDMHKQIDQWMEDELDESTCMRDASIAICYPVSFRGQKAMRWAKGL